MTFENVVFMLCSGVTALSLSLAIFRPEVLKNFFKKENPTWFQIFLQVAFIAMYILGLFSTLIVIWNTYLNM